MERKRESFDAGGDLYLKIIILLKCFDISFKWLGIFLPAPAILCEIHFHTVIPQCEAD